MILIAVVIVLLSVWIYRSTRKPEMFPPGPPRLPLVGSLPFVMGKKDQPSLLAGLEENVKKFGPVFGFYFGRTPAVVIADFNILKEAFKNDSLSARPSLAPMNEVRPGWHHMDHENQGRLPGVIFSNGNYWKTLRRFMLRNLRDFGFGKSSMEELLIDEVSKFCQHLDRHKLEPVDLAGMFNLSIVNALWSMITGERLQLDDPALSKVVFDINKLVRSVSPLSPLAALLPHPSMAKWPILNKLSGFSLINKTFKEAFPALIPYVEEHKRTLDPENVRDFLDLMLLEHQKAAGPESPFFGTLGEFTILNSMMDLFFAGMETTSSSLVNLFLQILHHPEVQDKIHEEIDKVVGRNRFPSLEDQSDLHYTNAVLQESFRVSSLVFNGIPHCTTQDMKVGEFRIPKGTTVFSFLYHIHHDPKYYADPKTFNPSRFIDKSGGFIADERIIPFSIGKRVCIGQSVAEKEFFIFFSAMMQQFEFEPEPDTPLPDYRDIYPKALLRSVPPYKVILKRRY